MLKHPPESFETIASEHYEALFRFALSLTRDESEAGDLTQQTFYTWAIKGHQLNDFSKVKPWLYTTLHRAFLTTRRRQSRFLPQDINDLAEQLPAVSLESGLQPDLCHVLPALARIDEVFQAPVTLFYLEDYSYKEIAAILGIPMGTVKSRIARGILQLRAVLGFAEPQPVPASGGDHSEMQFAEAAGFQRTF